MVNDEVEVKDFWREGGRHRGFGQTAGKLRLAPPTGIEALAATPIP